MSFQKPHIPASFNMYLVINKWVTAVKVSDFSGHYLHNCSTLDIGVLGYIGIVWPKEHSPEVSHIPPVTPCIIWVVDGHWIHNKYMKQCLSVWSNQPPFTVLCVRNYCYRKVFQAKLYRTPQKTLLHEIFIACLMWHCFVSYVVNDISKYCVAFVFVPGNPRCFKTSALHTWRHGITAPCWDNLKFHIVKLRCILCVWFRAS